MEIPQFRGAVSSGKWPTTEAAKQLTFSPIDMTVEVLCDDDHQDIRILLGDKRQPDFFIELWIWPTSSIGRPLM